MARRNEKAPRMRGVCREDGVFNGAVFLLRLRGDHPDPDAVSPG